MYSRIMRGTFQNINIALNFHFLRKCHQVFITQPLETKITMLPLIKGLVKLAFF